MRKRRGNIYHRADGRYEGRITTSAPGGKQRQRSVYGRTREEVKEKLAQVQVDKTHGLLVEPSRQTVGDYLIRWLEDTCRPNVRAGTYALYAMVTRKHIVPRIGGLLLSRLTPAHLQGLLTALDKPGVRQTVFKVLNQSLKQALAWNLIVRNPAQAIVRPKASHREMQTLTPDQARRFLEVAKDDRYHALYAVLLGCGLRLGEALGLGWPDVDLERRTLTVQRQLSEVGGHKQAGLPTRLLLQPPKTARSRRTVDLPDFVVEALRQHHERMAAEGHLVTDHLLVFVDQDGGFVRKSNLRRRSWAPLLRQAGIPYLRLHDLRHTAATHMFQEGVHPRVVQERLGHANIGITLGIYSHVLPTMQRDAADKIDALLKPQP